MAMNSGQLKNEMKAALLAALQPFYGNIGDDHALTGYDLPEYLEKFCTAVATTVVNHIQANARAVGNDSGGDNHNLDIT